jgi:hypothetical protein
MSNRGSAIISSAAVDCQENEGIVNLSLLDVSG